jgi:hypothetical protein
LATSRLSLTEWLPDQPSVLNTMQDVTNLIPLPTGYFPFPLAVDYSNAASEALTGNTAGKYNDTIQIFAGSASKLYKYNTTNQNLDDVSKVGGYGGIYQWRFTQFGSAVLAANNHEPIQAYYLNAGGNFQDLGNYISATYTRTGTTITVTTSSAHGYTTGQSYNFYFKSGGALSGVYTITVTTTTQFTITTTASGTIATSNVSIYSSTAPIAKFVTVVRDFVVAGHLNGGTDANKLQWSDISNETNWNSGSTSQSDYQYMADGGNIVGLTGGQYGIILMEKAVYRMSYLGSPLFFQFDAISRGLGCAEAGSVAEYAGLTYFLSNDGFYMCDGQTVSPIGVEKVDRYFYKTANVSLLSTMSTAIDPFKKIVIWNYANSLGGRTLLVYNYVVKKWSKCTTDVNYIAPIITTGISLESLDAYGNMDTLTTSLDDPLWAGGKYLFSGVRGNKLVSFTGANSSASVTIGDWETKYNGVITLVRPQIEDGSATVAISSRKNLGDNISFKTASAADSNGRCSVRSAGRYHQIQVVPTGNWTSLVSIDVDVTDQGNR